MKPPPKTSIQRLSKDDHEHDDAVKSACLRAGRALDENRLTEWVHHLLVERGQDLLRTRGILSISGHDRQYGVQAVQMLMEGTYTKPWGPHEKRESRLVFIGRNIDELDLRQQFKAWVA